MAKIVKSKKRKINKHQARQQREAKQTRIIIIVTIVIGVMILGLVGYGLVDQLIVRPRTKVAEVGDTTIRVKEFESQVQYTRVQMLNQTYQYYSFYQQFSQFGESFLQNAQSIASQLSQPAALGRDVLDEMIDNIIVREEAAERGITASEEEIDEALQTAFGFFPAGSPTPTQTATLINTPTLSETSLALVTLTPSPTSVETSADTPEASPTLSEEVEEETEGETEDDIVVDEAEATPTPELTPTITLTPTPFTTEVFGENLNEFNELYNAYDFSITDLRDVFEVQILRDKLQEVVTADLVPVEEEVWARHILVETEEEAQEVLEALEAGESFHDLAADYSIDESNSGQGGDLGWFDNQTMVTPFTEAAFSLEVGEISEPVQTDFGYHIIQMLGERESQVPPDEFQAMKLEAFTNWLSEQRNAREDIVIYDRWENFVPTTPEVPQQLLIELFQQQQNTVPPTTP